MPAVLNLSNEVVKMRAEVKRVKVFVIRKLTRHIVTLKKKKGSEADLEKYQRRVAKLLEEIHVLKALVPDIVTKTALQSDISFEKVCQNKDASMSERATARIATHPEFSRRIQSIKTAIEAFKAERTSAAKAEKKTAKKSRNIDQEERESDLDSDEDDEEDDEDNDDSFQKMQKADEGKLKEPTKQNENAPITATENSLEADSAPAEVVRMRKEVKKLRVLIIRNLAQQIASLKTAKAEDSELEGNKERVAQLQKEVLVLRTLLPDHVTTRALEGHIDLEKVLQDPESSPADRATAWIATHPGFVKKLQDVRQAIEGETTKAAKAGERNKEVRGPMKAEDSDPEVEEEEEEDEEDGDDEEEEEENETAIDDGGGDGSMVMVDKEVKETHPALNVTRKSDVKTPKDTKSTFAKEKSKGGEPEKAAKCPANLKTSSKPAVKASAVPSKNKAAAPPTRQVVKLDTKKPENGNDKEESESDLSDADEEKEYFDDSTEERFHKQSSYSEQSDDDDDFFLGKVSKLKKKKSDTAPRKEKTIDPDKALEKEASETSQFKMQSVFCSTLSKSSGASQKGKHGGPKPPRFQNQRKHSEGDEKPSWFKRQGSANENEKRPLASFKNDKDQRSKGQGSRQKGPGGGKTGKPAFERQNAQFSKPGRHSQQALHPSWEASRKRKEQQAQITAFQGKKIKFDDDDD